MSNPRKITHGRGTSWEITYRIDGRMARRRFPTRALAVDELAKARVDIARGMGLLPVDAKITLAEYSEQWLATLQVRPSTRANYVSYLSNHVLPALGRRPLSVLRRSDIAAFVAALVDKGLAASTIKHIYNVLAMVLRSACYDRVLNVSPCQKIKLPAIPGRTLPMLSPVQVHALLAAAPDYDRAVLATAVGTGMRQGETLGLRLVHLNMLRREIAVEQQAMSPSGGPPYLTSDLKTAASRRMVPLPDFVLAELARHLQTYGTGVEGVVFANRRGGIWRRGSFNDSVWKPALRRAGLDPGLRVPLPAAHLRLWADRGEHPPPRHPGPAGPQVDRGDDGHLRSPVPRGPAGDDLGAGPAVRRRLTGGGDEGYSKYPRKIGPVA